MVFYVLRLYINKTVQVIPRGKYISIIVQWKENSQKKNYRCLTNEKVPMTLNTQDIAFHLIMG